MASHERRARKIIGQFERLGFVMPTDEEMEATDRKESEEFDVLRRRVALRERLRASIGSWTFFFVPGVGLRIVHRFGPPHLHAVACMAACFGIDTWEIVAEPENESVLIKQPPDDVVAP